MDKIPGIFSKEFHLRFFPALLISRLKREENASPFSSGHMHIDYLLFLAISLIAAILGISAGLRGSLIGWGFGILGAAGFIFLAVRSIIDASDEKPSFYAFRFGIFFFVLTLGLSAGLWWGAIASSRLIGICAGLAGLFIGYWAGLFMGLQIQRLGWIGGIADVLAIAGIAGLAVVDLIGIYVLFF